MAGKKWSAVSSATSLSDTDKICAIVGSGTDANKTITKSVLYQSPIFSGAVDMSGASSVTAPTANTASGNEVLTANSIKRGNHYIEILTSGANTSATKPYAGISIGFSSGTAQTTAQANTLIGNTVGNLITTGSGNVAIGASNVMNDNVSGNNNVAIGNAAGNNITGNGNTCIGVGTGVLVTGGINETVIGADTTGSGSNTVAIGGQYTRKTRLTGELKIESNTPVVPTGTITYTGSYTTLSGGNGTNFKSFKVGDSIYIAGQTGIITTITSNISIDVSGLSAPFPTNSTFTITPLASNYDPKISLSRLNTAPAYANATGVVGEIRFCSDAIYVCTATNTWKKTAIATW